MSTQNLRNDLGPYKATKLWNDIVRVFRTGMPIGRHWKQLRSFEDCFVACDAVEWLLEYLQQHHESGPEINRIQVIKLLQKFHNLRYMEDVRGSKYDEELFEENNRLFRFVALSPVKTPQWPKQPISSHQPNLTEFRARNIFQDPECERETNRRNEEIQARVQRSLPVRCMKNTDHIWKSKVLSSLREVLGLTDLKPIIDDSQLTYHNAKHNLTLVHKNGYVTGIDKNQLPPSWVVSAMRFLAKWPDIGNETYPEYPGFEKDVFSMIKDYFDDITESITTTKLSNAVISIYDYVYSIEPSPIVDGKTRVLHVSDTTPRTHFKTSPPHTHHKLPSYNSKHQKYDSDYHSNSTGSDVHPHIPHKSNVLHGQSRVPVAGSDNVMIVYDSPVKQNPLAKTSSIDNSRPSQHASDVNGCHYYKQEEHYGSYRTAIENKFNQKPAVVNSNNNNNKPRRLQHRSTSMQRAASLSQLLAGPRIETAFVGNDAYTVYYGAPRNRSREMNNLNIPPTVGRSCFNLYRAPSVGYLDENTANNKGKRRDGLLTRPLSAYYPPPRNTITAATRESTRPQTVPPLYNSQSIQNLNKNLASPEKATPTYTTSQFYTCTSQAWDNEREKLWGSTSYLRNASDDSKRSRSQAVVEAVPRRSHEKPPAHRSHSTGRRSEPSNTVQGAKYEDAGSIDIQIHSTPSIHLEQSPPSSLFGAERDCKLIQSYQRLLLFLPPANRRILHMLLKLLNKLSQNGHLQLHDQQTNKQHTGLHHVLSSMWRTILRAESDREQTAAHVVDFLVDNFDSILSIPHDLKSDIESEITNIHTAQSRVQQQTVQAAPPPARPAALRSRTNLQNVVRTSVPPKAVSRLGISPKSHNNATAFCQRVSTAQYESEAANFQRSAMLELLNNIIDDTKMVRKEKAKKLKQFEKSYPDIYSARIPNQDYVRQILANSRKSKHRTSLTKPLKALRNLR